MPVPRSPAELLRLTQTRTHEELHVSLPARVLAFHPADQTVDVEFAVELPIVTGEDDEIEWEAAPNLAGVPVAFPRGGGYFLSVPLVAGDFVWVMFTDAAFGQWRYSGQVPSQGPETRRHGLSGAWAMPGAFPLKGKLSDAAGDELRLGKDNATPQIQIKTDGIVLGKGAADFVALASKVSDELNKIKATLDTGSTSAGAVTFGTPYVPGSVAAAWVKAR